jgi:hypothetical protein
MTGLESHIVQQCRFGEGIFGYRVRVVNTLPPPEKVQQFGRVFAGWCRPPNYGRRDKLTLRRNFGTW